MKFNVLTIFPDIFPGNLGSGLIGKALHNAKFHLNLIDLTLYKDDGRIDDRPIGGQEGMIIKAQTIDNAIKHNNLRNNKIIYLSPRGQVFNQSIANNLLYYENITLICGRYEGIDARILLKYDIQELSIGDFILCGGEVAAMVVIETVVRLIPSVLKNQQSIMNESFSNYLLEHDYFTKPDNWSAMIVPDILKSGNHKEIKRWQFINSYNITKQNRPDLILLFNHDFIIVFFFFNIWKKLCFKIYQKQYINQ